MVVSALSAPFLLGLIGGAALVGIWLLLRGGPAGLTQQPAIILRLVDRAMDPFPGAADQDGMLNLIIGSGPKAAIGDESIPVEELGRRLKVTLSDAAEQIVEPRKQIDPRKLTRGNKATQHCRSFPLVAWISC